MIFFKKNEKRGDFCRVLNLATFLFFVIPCIFLFLTQESFATMQTSNPQPTITATFQEPVNVINTSLFNVETNKQIGLELIENTSNKIFKYRPSNNLTEGTYNFTIYYKDSKIEGLNSSKSYIFIINFSIPKKPNNLTINTVDKLEAGTWTHYMVEANYDDGLTLPITGNSELEKYLTVSSNNTNILTTNKNPPIITGIYPGTAKIIADYLEANGSRTINVTEPPFIKMLTPWNNGTHAYANSERFDIIIYTFRNSECKWSKATKNIEYMQNFSENESDFKYHIIRDFSFIGSSTDFYVYCKATDNEELKTYIIRKETTVPKVTLQVNNVYNPIYGSNLFENEVKAQTDRPAVCKYAYDRTDTFDFSYPELNFDNLPYYFKTYSNMLESERDFFTYVNSHKITLLNLEDKIDYKVVVICKGLSNLTSEIAQATFSVNSGAEPKVEVLSPPRYISTTGTTKTVNFEVQTNRFAYCTYFNDSFENKEQMNSEDYLIHRIRKTFTLGEHKVYFSCIFYTTNDEIPIEYTFTIDNSSPIIYYVNDSTEYSNPEQSGTNKSLRFKVIAEDNESGLQYINYSLWQKGSDNESNKIIVNWSLVGYSSDWIIVFFNLENMRTYYFNVSVINNAKMSSNFNVSDGVTINTSLQMNLCANHVFNPEINETDVDCGGNVCQDKCTYGRNCSVNSDCLTGFCNNITKKCVYANETNETKTCNNNKKDGDETDVDCGGSCPGCSKGKSCKKDSDCKSGLECSNGKCSEKKECNVEIDEDCDGVKDDFDKCPNTPNNEGVDDDGCSESQKKSEEEKDSDGDGIPDWWEEKYGLNPDDPSDANEDLDGDGYSNLKEYQNKTDPTVKDKKTKEEGEDSEKTKKGFPILLLILLLILIGGLIGFLVYTQFVKPKSKTGVKKQQKTQEIKLSEVKQQPQIQTPQKQVQIPKVEFKQEPMFKKPAETRPLTPDQLAAIRRRARVEEKKRIFEQFEEKPTIKKSEETQKLKSEAQSKEETKKIKEKTKEEVKEKTEKEEKIGKKINPELGIIELELPEEERKKFMDLEGKDVFERLEKLGKRVEGKNIEEELKKLTKGKKDVYKELSKLAEKKKK